MHLSDTKESFDTHKIRFPDQNCKFIEIKNDGFFSSMILAKTNFGPFLSGVLSLCLSLPVMGLG